MPFTDSTILWQIGTTPDGVNPDQIVLAAPNATFTEVRIDPPYELAGYIFQVQATNALGQTDESVAVVNLFPQPE